ncbi:unnamed protein product [Nyctereutes procyonoides]|uniref:(raccoon dog) hypothetical protein n=1 Tax=Nyctereutes procyonoides TaxID=34880 RepID=A0A811Y9G3_NYCPR|nr:unnamed protein product [Nyctereutes procyonoides]
MGSVVDEHFSRALSNVKSPQGLSTLSQGTDWCFSSQWTKPEPEPEASFAYGAINCSLSGPSSRGHTDYGSVPSPWHYPSLASPSTSKPVYSQVYSGGHVISEPQPNGNDKPFLMWENYNSAQIARSTGLHPSSAHYKKIYFATDGGPASANLASEKSQSPERRDVFFY